MLSRTANDHVRSVCLAALTACDWPHSYIFKVNREKTLVQYRTGSNLTAGGCYRLIRKCKNFCVDIVDVCREAIRKVNASWETIHC